MDDEDNRRQTGALNGLILDNLSLINQTNKPIYIRIPLIPGSTFSQKNIHMIVDFTQTFNSIVRYDILPFHQLGAYKYRALGISYKLENLKAIKPSALSEIMKIFTEAKLNFKVFGF